MLLGCGGTSASAPGEQIDDSPPARFARFMADFRRRCEETNAALVDEAAGGAGASSVRTIIDVPTYVLDEPQTPGGAYTAQVTIVTRVTFSSVTPAAPSPETPRKLVPLPAGRKKLPAASDEVPAVEDYQEMQSSSRSDEFRDTLDFAFVEERWQLKSRDLSESLRMQIERSLAAQ